MIKTLVIFLLIPSLVFGQSLFESSVNGNDTAQKKAGLIINGYGRGSAYGGSKLYNYSNVFGEFALQTKAAKGKVAAVTSDAQSPLAKLADLIVIIPSRIRHKEHVHYEVGELLGSALTPLGTLFEVSTLIFFESCVAELMRQLGVKEEEMQKIHANI